MKVQAEAAAWKLVFLVAAVPATAEHTLGRYGIQVRSADALYQTHRHKIEPGVAAMFTALHRGECPDLLWTQWHCGASRHDVASLRTAVKSVSKLTEAQLAQGRAVLMEGRACDPTLNDQVLNAPKLLGSLLGPPTVVF